jgi:hypothetical protein
MPYCHEIRCLMSVSLFPRHRHTISAYCKSHLPLVDRNGGCICGCIVTGLCNRTLTSWSSFAVVALDHTLRMCTGVEETGKLTSNTWFHGGRASVTVKICTMTIIWPKRNTHFLWSTLTPLFTHKKWFPEKMMYTWNVRQVLVYSMLLWKLKRKMMVESYNKSLIFFATLVYIS